MGATLRIFLGIIFLILGVIGSVLPVLQGWIFFVLAALMFFPNHPRTEKIMVKIEARFPKIGAFLRKFGFGLREDHLESRDVKELVHHRHDPESAQKAAGE